MRSTTMFAVFVAGVASTLLVIQLINRPATAQITNFSPPLQSRFLTPRSMDADGLEELFNRVARNGGIAWLPGGVYRINRTIRIDGLGPIRIEGEGQGDFFNPEGTGFKSQPSRLVWTGEPGGTMLSIDYSSGLSFSHMQFDGRGRAGKLVQLRSKPGWGAGNLRFTRVVFRAADVGLQCGEDEKEPNSADNVYDEVTFVGCKIGFKTVNHQSVNHHFRSLGVQQCGVALDFERGGNLNVDGWSATNFDLFLRISTGGPNAGIFRLVAGRPEMAGLTKRFARLLEAKDLHSCQVIFEATQETGAPINDRLTDNSTEPVFEIGNKTMLSLRNHYHFRPSVKMDGGVYIDEDGRWDMNVVPDDPAQSQINGGTVRIVSPRNLAGEMLKEMKRN